MKIFESNKNTEWEDKVNFVDENNVFVGYDLGQDCCENANWFIADAPKNEILENDKSRDVSEYQFDTSYFKRIDGSGYAGETSYIDGGGMVIFRLKAKNKPDIYLHLFNCQNGYYGHGFEAKIGDEKWKDGLL